MVLHLRVHHGMRVGCGGASLLSILPVVAALVVLVVVPAALVGEVGGAFMLVGAAIVLEAADDLVDVGGGVLVQLLVVAEDDDGDVDGAEDGELVGLLEEAALALEEGDGTIGARDVSIVDRWGGGRGRGEWRQGVPIAIIADGLDLSRASAPHPVRMGNVGPVTSILRLPMMCGDGGGVGVDVGDGVGVGVGSSCANAATRLRPSVPTQTKATRLARPVHSMKPAQPSPGQLRLRPETSYLRQPHTRTHSQEAGSGREGVVDCRSDATAEPPPNAVTAAHCCSRTAGRRSGGDKNRRAAAWERGNWNEPTSAWRCLFGRRQPPAGPRLNCPAPAVSPLHKAGLVGALDTWGWAIWGGYCTVMAFAKGRGRRGVVATI